MNALLVPALRRALLEALAVAAGCAVLGLAFNALRPTGAIPVIAREPYALLVPCPVQGGEVAALPPGDPQLAEEGTVIVDAREKGAFDAWRLPRARSVPFDYLEPVSREHVEALLASGAARIVVYGDGQDPDSGRELARELAGQGLRHVFYVEGGAPALGAKGAP